MNNIITINNVRAYIDENGTARLNLADCARGLGFIEKAKSGNETIRWRTVRSYLSNFGVIATSCDAVPQFIPENIFFRLAMKAKNEVAEKFQTVVCDEILPQIRKTGSYQQKPMSQLEIAAETAKALVEQEKRLGGVEKEVKILKNDLPLFNIDCKEIQAAVRKCGITHLGGTKSNAYKDASIRGKVYSDIQRQLKREFQVSSYAAIKHSQIELALSIISNYKLPAAIYGDVYVMNNPELL